MNAFNLKETRYQHQYLYWGTVNNAWAQYDRWYWESDPIPF